MNTPEGAQNKSVDLRGEAAPGQPYAARSLPDRIILSPGGDIQPDKVAEDTSLFQAIDVAPDRLGLRAYLNTGVLYDGFDFVKTGAGNLLEDLAGDLPTVRRCSDPPQQINQPTPAARLGPDGLPCTAKTND